MMLARWQIDARFGHKDAALELMRQWWRKIAPQIGWDRDRVRIASGSLGVAESRIEVEVRIPDLADLGEAWQRLATARGQGEWARLLAEHIVSGSARWRVYRSEDLANGAGSEP